MRHYQLFRFCVLFCFFLSGAFATPPQKMIFFGDSLTDNGNLFRLDLHLLPKSPPYFAGRFSNGPTWAENVAQTYINEYQIKYNIYAWGGATSIAHNPFTQLVFPVTLTVELDRYLLDNLFKDKSGTLFSFWIGGNDYLFDTVDEADPLTTQVIHEIDWAIRRLINDHGNKFLILNLPDLSNLPLARGGDQDAARLHILSVMHNQKLNEAVKKIQLEYPAVTLVYVDINFFFKELLSNPEKYNKKRHTHIKDTTHSCWEGPYYLMPSQNRDFPFSQKPQPLSGGSSVNAWEMNRTTSNSPDLYEAYRLSLQAEKGYKPCDNPDEYIFWDLLHPTAVAHRMIAARVLEDLAAAGLR